MDRISAGVHQSMILAVNAYANLQIALLGLVEKAKTAPIKATIYMLEPIN